MDKRNENTHENHKKEKKKRTKATRIISFVYKCLEIVHVLFVYIHFLWNDSLIYTQLSIIPLLFKYCFKYQPMSLLRIINSTNATSNQMLKEIFFKGKVHTKRKAIWWIFPKAVNCLKFYSKFHLLFSLYLCFVYHISWVYFTTFLQKLPVLYYKYYIIYN